MAGTKRSVVAVALLSGRRPGPVFQPVGPEPGSVRDRAKQAEAGTRLFKLRRRDGRSLWETGVAREGHHCFKRLAFLLHRFCDGFLCRS